MSAQLSPGDLPLSRTCFLYDQYTENSTIAPGKSRMLARSMPAPYPTPETGSIGIRSNEIRSERRIRGCRNRLLYTPIFQSV